jgi:hypothetical protein
MFVVVEDTLVALLTPLREHKLVPKWMVNIDMMVAVDIEDNCMELEERTGARRRILEKVAGWVGSLQSVVWRQESFLFG